MAFNPVSKSVMPVFFYGNYYGRIFDSRSINLIARHLINKVGIENIRRKSLKITQYLMDLVDEELTQVPYNFAIGNPRDDKRRGGHVAIEHEMGKRIDFALRERGILTDFRPPTTIRLTPVPLYTSYIEVWECVQHMKAVIDNKDYELYSNVRMQYT